MYDEIQFDNNAHVTKNKTPASFTRVPLTKNSMFFSTCESSGAAAAGTICLLMDGKTLIACHHLASKFHLLKKNCYVFQTCMIVLKMKSSKNAAIGSYAPRYLCKKDKMKFLVPSTQNHCLIYTIRICVH